MTPEQELALIDNAITARLTPGGINRFREGGHEVEFTDLAALYKRKDQLEQIVAQQSGIFQPVVQSPLL